jgi:hypothetical protein
MGIAAVPTGTTGNVVVTMSGNMSRCGIGLWRIIGLVSAVNHDSINTIVGADNNPTGTIDVPANGIVIAQAYNQGATLRTVTWAGVSEDYDEEVSSGRSHHGGSVGSLGAETGRTITAAFDASAGAATLLAASWA